jgi:hypothetical protein
MEKKLQNLTIKFILLASIAIGYLFLCSGCYTKKRAIEKFCRPIPSQIKIDTTINFVEIAKGDSGKVSLPCEEFRALYDSLLKAKSSKIDSNGFKTIFENDKTKLKAKPGPNGSIDLNVVDKGDTIRGEINLKLTKEAPCNCPPCPEIKLTYLEWFDRQGFFVQAFHVVIGLFALLFAGTILISWFNSWRSK